MRTHCRAALCLYFTRASSLFFLLFGFVYCPSLFWSLLLSLFRDNAVSLVTSLFHDIFIFICFCLFYCVNFFGHYPYLCLSLLLSFVSLIGLDRDKKAHVYAHSLSRKQMRGQTFHHTYPLEFHSRARVRWDESRGACAFIARELHEGLQHSYERQIPGGTRQVRRSEQHANVFLNMR